MTEPEKLIEESAVVRRLGGRLAVCRLEEIDLADRYRKDYGNLQELAVSMKSKGQLQNIVVCTQDNPEKPYRLLAGGRRFRTMSEILGWQTANCLIFEEELTELDLLEIEWEENRDRKDMTWQEEVALKSAIHERKMALHGPKISKEPDAEGWSMRDTAKLLGKSPATVSLDLALSKAVTAVPEMFTGCKTKKDAQKVLSIAGEQLLRSELAKRAEDEAKQGNGASRLKSILDRYQVRDFFDGVKDITDSSIDFVEIDPPYAIDLQKAKMNYDNKYQSDDYNEVDMKDYIPFITNTLRECHRVMNEHSWGIIWHAVEWQDIIYRLLINQGFEVTRLTGTWVKPSGQCKRPEQTMANCKEDFFYFRKGNPTIVKQGHVNVFPYTPVASSKKYHPTERPIELIQEILSVFCWEGAKILVPFAGSGKTILAAESMKMVAIGYDLTKSYKDGYTVLAAEMFGGK